MRGGRRVSLGSSTNHSFVTFRLIAFHSIPFHSIPFPSNIGARLVYGGDALAARQLTHNDRAQVRRGRGGGGGTSGERGQWEKRG